MESAFDSIVVAPLQKLLLDEFDFGRVRVDVDLKVALTFRRHRHDLLDATARGVAIHIAGVARERHPRGHAPVAEDLAIAKLDDGAFGQVELEAGPAESRSAQVVAAPDSLRLVESGLEVPEEEADGRVAVFVAEFLGELPLCHGFQGHWEAPDGGDGWFRGLTHYRIARSGLVTLRVVELG